MEKKRPLYETDPVELELLRKRLAELAMNLNGTLTALPEDVKQEYRNAEQSVIEARSKAWGREGLIVIR